MRLLSRTDGRLEISADKPPQVPYAILSHTWLADEEEVTYNDIIQNSVITTKKGYAKLNWCLEQAAVADIHHVWIDTCCINKGDATELQQALNSMFAWYAESKVCYVYLADVSSLDNWTTRFRNSRWFTRGWTLQELVAPQNVRFYTSDFLFIGTSTTLDDVIGEATGIELTKTLDETSLADRFSWSLSRTTSRPEDRSYCLLGILDVAMVPFYGENAERAQDRLFEAVEREHGRRAARSLLRRQIIWELEQERYASVAGLPIPLVEPRTIEELENTYPEILTQSPLLLHDVVQTKDFEAICSVLDRPDLGFPGSALDNALYSSLESPYFVVRKLLEKGADFARSHSGKQRREALFKLCARADEPPSDIMVQLLEHVKARQKKKAQNPAIKRILSSFNIHDLLTESDARYLANSDSTPLESAVYRGHTHLVQLLLDKGALVRADDSPEHPESILLRCCLDSTFRQSAALHIVLQHKTCQGSGIERALKLLAKVRNHPVANKEMVDLVVNVLGSEWLWAWTHDGNEQNEHA